MLLAVIDANPALVTPYGVSKSWMSARAWVTELIRFVNERAAAKALSSTARSRPHKSSSATTCHRRSWAWVTRHPGWQRSSTPPLSDQDNDVLAAMIDEDSNLAVIVLERLGVPLDVLRASL